MKTYDVLLTEQAEKDLDGIFEYIAFVLEEFENAKRQIARIQKAIEGLETMPERHKAYENGSWKNRNTHYFPVDRYYVFYTVDNVSDMVSVFRIMYSARDIDAQLLHNTKY